MPKFYTYFLPILLLLFSCSDEKQVEKNYIHVDGRDTSTLRLVVYEKRFYGELIHKKGGVAPSAGEINGDIYGDTLIGDFHYRPYKWKEKKRVPIALLKKGDSYTEVTGQMIEIMGILRYIDHTIQFDKPKRIYMEIR